MPNSPSARDSTAFAYRSTRYHHFKDDMNSKTLKEKEFKHMHQGVGLCAKHKTYTIHAVLGQHSPITQHSGVTGSITTALSGHGSRYLLATLGRWIYPINEQCGSEHWLLLAFYDGTEPAIRGIVTHYYIFGLHGNTSAME
ncbi:glycoside hydrolase family 5 protein [Aplosporella prunicola CBS 121167]|uniref:Glycoside hydrolase family 5 protein n=1 Tax=Aplosporella prunicola CBS 121167 TaxID=1176127 RepID=A0A6A6AYM6_9PEZI|nr:glycoside hydrolase family 5 protein [Aplosporella prunicola CBS 121167]KAF2135877.1 glycoside hydrolase family 5 protein [Aplosporella prunicola CBS 121167]